MSHFDFALLPLAILVMGIAIGLWIAGYDQFMFVMLGAVVLSTWFELKSNKRREKSNG
ncbi:MAG: hypothetical protein GW858_03155 [Sphingomonadales bacterium]|nr:hypothetical protein [Sphingomonadales bacterium]NCT02604.1 hypothetical protein [Sphingomonadales bacterium]